MGCIRRLSRTVLTALVVICGVIYIASLAVPKKPADTGVPTAELSSPVPAATATTGLSVQSVDVPTSTSAPTMTASATITDTPQPAEPPTTAPTIAPTTAPAAADGVTSISPVTYYAGANGANLRSCPTRECDRVASVAAGVALVVNGTVQGETVSGSTLWYRVAYGDQTSYVHSSILTNAATVVQSSQPVAPAQSVPTAAAAQVWSCVGDLYNCSSFSDRNALMSYFNSCSGDPSNLDGDGNGIPCESSR